MYRDHQSYPAKPYRIVNLGKRIRKTCVVGGVKMVMEVDAARVNSVRFPALVWLRWGGAGRKEGRDQRPSR